MASIDKVAIVFSIAITAIGASIGLVGLSGDSTNSTLNTPVMSDVSELVPSQPSSEPVLEPTPGPQTHAIEIPEGTSFIGCQETDECYIPASITISAGDTLEWFNYDVSAHTVTSGSPSTGPNGIFDSSLFQSDTVFEIQLDEPGNYDYFCLIHPWMIGMITVN